MCDKNKPHDKFNQQGIVWGVSPIVKLYTSRQGLSHRLNECLLAMQFMDKKIKLDEIKNQDKITTCETESPDHECSSHRASIFNDILGRQQLLT